MLELHARRLGTTRKGCLSGISRAQPCVVAFKALYALTGQMHSILSPWRRHIIATCSLTAALMVNSILAEPIQRGEIFSDQSSIYETPVEPSDTTPVTVAVRTHKGNVNSVQVKYFDAGDQQFHGPIILAAHSVDPTDTFELWKGTIPASLSTKYYRFRISNDSETIWLNAGGISSSEPADHDFWIIPNFHTPNWAKSAVYYQIFVDRFFNGDPSNDPKTAVPFYPYTSPPGYENLKTYFHTQWLDMPLPPQASTTKIPDGLDFFGGDLAGVRQKLDPYLKQRLGVTALYLNPIFRSPSNHKYDTQDYETVDPAFGANDDLRQLIRDAHSDSNFPGDHRVSILLDAVVNHTSTAHSWFNRELLYTNFGAFQGIQSPLRDFYKFYPDGSYLQWGGVPSLAKLTYTSTPLRDRIYRTRSSVLQEYLSPPYSIDGWRFDVASLLTFDGSDNSANSHAFWQDARPFLKSANPEGLILAEYWDGPGDGINANDWLHGNEWDGIMNYNGFCRPVSKWITGREMHMADNGGQPSPISTTQFDGWIRGVLADYPRPCQLVMMNSLSTHDIARFKTRGGGGIAGNWALKEAVIFQMTFIGAPSIYYGDEVGIEGGDDPDNRRTFDWTKVTADNEILSLHQKLVKIRQAHSALRDGSYLPLLISDSPPLYAFGRWNEFEKLLIVLNNDSTGHDISIDVSDFPLADGVNLTDLLTETKYTVTGRKVVLLGLLGHFGAILHVTTPASSF